MATVISLSKAREQRHQEQFEADQHRAESLAGLMAQLDQLLVDFDQTDRAGKLQQVAVMFRNIEDFRCELDQIEDMTVFLHNIALQESSSLPG